MIAAAIPTRRQRAGLSYRFAATFRRAFESRPVLPPPAASQEPTRFDNFSASAAALAGAWVSLAEAKAKRRNLVAAAAVFRGDPDD